MKVLLVTGLGDSRGSLSYLIRRYRPNTIIPYYKFPDFNHYSYRWLVGHSMGAMYIQRDYTVPSYKIVTIGAPFHYRGRQDEDFISGHTLKYR